MNKQMIRFIKRYKLHKIIMYDLLLQYWALVLKRYDNLSPKKDKVQPTSLRAQYI